MNIKTIDDVFSDAHYRWISPTIPINFYANLTRDIFILFQLEAEKLKLFFVIPERYYVYIDRTILITIRMFQSFFLFQGNKSKITK